MTRQQHYIDDKGAAALKAYKYKGEDRSYYYRYVLTPMNIRLIEFVPVWLAPNVITLLGLAITVLGHTLTALYSPDFTAPIPSWLCAFCAVCIFSYQTLDNLDGRQARRTGSSSPLGMLFDHGVDALNCTVGAVMVATVLQMGSTPLTWGLWITVITAFFFATWEEFYTDELILPEINGPSDGQLITIGLLLTGAAYPGIWGTPIQDVPKVAAAVQALGAPSDVWGLKMHALVLGLSVFCLVPTALSNIRNVYLKGSHSFAASLLTLAPFIVLEVLSGLWLFHSPANVFASHPRTFLLGMGFLFGQLAAKLMLAHLTNSSYSPIRLSLVPLVLLSSIFVWPSARAVAAPLLPQISEQFALVLVAALGCAAWLHFVVFTIQDMTSILDIACFRIRPKPINPPPSVTVSRSPSPPASLTVAANGRLKGGKTQ